MGAHYAFNLGVIFDSDFNFRKHISLTCRSHFYHIRDLRRIRRYISLSVAKTILLQHSLLVGLITATIFFITSHLRILWDSSVQNCLARVVTRSHRFYHSVPLLKSLHWLPAQSRNIFKLCTIAYQTLSSEEPSYLFFTLSLAPKPRDPFIWFSLVVSSQGKNLWRTRAFSIAVPTLWYSTLWTC